MKDVGVVKIPVAEVKSGPTLRRFEYE